MTAYRFRCFNDDGQILSTASVDCHQDGDAIQATAHYFGDVRIRSIEVWNDSRMVADVASPVCRQLLSAAD